MFEINEKGLAEIREILSAHHKAWLGMDHADIPHDTVCHYADEAEDNENGSFEIGRFYTASGNPEVFYISDDGVDVQ